MLEAIVLLTVLLMFAVVVGRLSEYTDEKCRKEYMRDRMKAENKRQRKC